MSAVPVSAVLIGLAEWLHAAGLAVWRPTGSYAADEKAITLKALPAAPDSAVALTVYDIGDDIVLPDVEAMVQLRFRASAEGPRTDVDDFADSVFTALHGARNLPVGSLVIQQARRVSVAPLGADDNRREERADNYALVFMRTS